jgi:hypothetical protein
MALVSHDLGFKACRRNTSNASATNSSSRLKVDCICPTRPSVLERRLSCLFTKRVSKCRKKSTRCSLAEAAPRQREEATAVKFRLQIPVLDRCAALNHYLFLEDCLKKIRVAGTSITSVHLQRSSVNICRFNFEWLHYKYSMIVYEKK